MRYRYPYYFMLLLLFFTAVESLCAQNLVQNHSFESYENCPKKLGTLDQDVAYWRNPTQGSSDYFHSCSSIMGVPKNFNGIQESRFGDGYVGFYFYTPNDYREYIQATLRQTLVAGEAYTLSFYVSLAENSDFAVDAFGVQFTEKPVTVGTKRNLGKRQISKLSGSVANAMELGEGAFYANTKDWVQVKKEFIATGTENYMLLGNFKTNKRSKVMRIQDKVTKGAYYYLDEVVLIPNNPKAHAGRPDRPAEISYKLDSIYSFKTVFFNFDEFNLLPKAKTELDAMAGYLNVRKKLNISIFGHTDALGTKAYNALLSKRRAEAVVQYLTNKGITEHRITYQGFGSEKPAMQNATEEGRKGNRRVEFKITK